MNTKLLDCFIIITEFNGDICVTEQTFRSLPDAVDYLPEACTSSAKLIGVYHLEGSNRWDETAKAIDLWVTKSDENAGSDEDAFSAFVNISNSIPSDRDDLHRAANQAHGFNW